MPNRKPDVILDNFWNIYDQISFAHCFCQINQEKLRAYTFRIDVATSIVGLVALSGLMFNEFIALAWPFILVSSQALIIIRDYLRIKEKTCALTYYISASSKILIDLEKDWVDIQAGRLVDEDIIIEKAAFYRTARINIENNYLREFEFNTSKNVQNQASVENERSLTAKHPESNEKTNVK